MSILNLYKIAVVGVLGVLLVHPVLAEDKLTICSQNLELFGASKGSLNSGVRDLDAKARKLAERFNDVGCDVIAVQEVLADSEAEIFYNLSKITKQLKFYDKNYNIFALKDYGSMQLGFIINAALFNNPNVKNFKYTILPKISRYEKNKYFTRSPLLLSVFNQKINETFEFINVHQKSVSVKSGFDKSGFSFEIDRIRNAAGIREILEHLNRTSSDSIRLILGDFNASIDSASVKIITGNINVNSISSGICDLMESGMVACSNNLNKNADFFSIMNQASYPSTPNKFNKYKYRFIDNILLATNSKRKISDIRSGYIPAVVGVSDHPLLWARITFK